MPKLISAFFEIVKNVFFPKCCINCSYEGEFICSDCFELIKRNKNPILYLENSLFTKLYIPCLYHGNPILARSVHKMKYTFYKDIAFELAELFIEVFKQHSLPNNCLLVPIPLHKKRLKFRGFNQSEILAKHIGLKLKLNVCNLLTRKNETKSQATLNRNERLQNLRGVFELNNANNSPKSTPILLIDDICTTLSTLTEAAKTLQKNGYTLIFGAALARAQLKNNYENRN